MSAPHTNIERQKRRHNWSLLAIGLSLLFAALLGAGWVLWAGDTPPNLPSKVDPVVMKPEKAN